MMILILSLFLVNSMSSFASNDTTSTTDGITPNSDTTYVIKMNDTCGNIDTNQLFTHIIKIEEEPAEFPGGEDALQVFIQKNIQYPIIAKNHGIEGKVYVTLTIDERGGVEDISFMNSIGGGCEEEVTRVLRKMPLWKPKKKAGNEVKSERTFSFTFKL